MLAKKPIKIENLKGEYLDNEILRLAIIAELDAINLYEQLAAMVKNEQLKKVLLDVAKEEKTHFAEFQIMLLKEDKEQVQEFENAKEEIEELIGK